MELNVIIITLLVLNLLAAASIIPPIWFLCYHLLSTSKKEDDLNPTLILPNHSNPYANPFGLMKPQPQPATPQNDSAKSTQKDGAGLYV